MKHLQDSSVFVELHMLARQEFRRQIREEQWAADTGTGRDIV